MELPEPAPAAEAAWAFKRMKIVKNLVFGFSTVALVAIGTLFFLGKPWGVYSFSSEKVSPGPLGYTYGGKPFSGFLFSRYPKGQLSRLSFFWKSLSHLKEFYWYENVQIRQIRNYTRGYPEGSNKSWYADGKPKSISHYQNGKLEGEAWSWHENGKPAGYAKYLDGNEIAFKSFTNREKPFHNLIRKEETLFGFKGDSKCDPINTGRR